MAKIVMGLFDNLADANAAAAQLSGLGIAQNHIRVVISEARNCLPDRAPQVRTGAASVHLIKPVTTFKCAVAGGLAGAVAGFLVVLVLLAVPGLHINAFAAMGALGSLLTGALAALAGGALLGMIIGAILTHRGEDVPALTRHGGAMASATVADDQAAAVEGIFSTHHATDLELRNAEWETAGQPLTVPATPAAGAPAQASIYTNPDRSTSARVYKP